MSYNVPHRALYLSHPVVLYLALYSHQLDVPLFLDLFQDPNTLLVVLLDAGHKDVSLHLVAF